MKDTEKNKVDMVHYMGFQSYGYDLDNNFYIESTRWQPKNQG